MLLIFAMSTCKPFHVSSAIDSVYQVIFFLYHSFFGSNSQTISKCYTSHDLGQHIFDTLEQSYNLILMVHLSLYTKFITVLNKEEPLKTPFYHSIHLFEGHHSQ